MNASILICTYKRDFRYLIYCLRSLNKFARGFHEVVLLFPESDWAEFTSQIGPEIMGQDVVNYRPMAFQEWPKMGMVHHMERILHSDEIFPHADFVGHFDADCILTGPTTPETFMQDGKPVLRYESFASISKRHPANLRWQGVTEICLPFPIHYETMRHPFQVFHTGLYPRTRELVEMKVGRPFVEYMKTRTNSFPQDFCEFVTLGNVAMNTFADHYHLHDMERQRNRDRVELPIIQCWSHAPPEQPVDLWIWGEQKRVVPLEIFKEYGLLDPVLAK